MGCGGQVARIGAGRRGQGEGTRGPHRRPPWLGVWVFASFLLNLGQATWGGLLCGPVRTGPCPVQLVSQQKGRMAMRARSSRISSTSRMIVRVGSLPRSRP